MTEEEKKLMGERLKLLRKKKGESQKKLGEIFNTSQKAISNYEKGATMIPLDIQIQYAEHYNVSHDFLCTGIDNNSILKLLETYIKLRYDGFSEGDESYEYPLLEIDQILFHYLFQSAQAKNLDIPNSVREKWIEEEIHSFYKHNKDNTFNEFETIIPVPEKLIRSNSNDKVWKQRDLIRETYNLFQKEAKKYSKYKSDNSSDTNTKKQKE